jgi:hypothetical protein
MSHGEARIVGIVGYDTILSVDFRRALHQKRVNDEFIVARLLVWRYAGTVRVMFVLHSAVHPET